MPLVWHFQYSLLKVFDIFAMAINLKYELIMPDFSKRSLLPEKMDDPAVAENEVVQALKELETINRFLGGYNVVLNALRQIEKTGQVLSIMDLGCGGGDTLRVIAGRFKQKKQKIMLTGIDWNPVMTRYAALNSEKCAGVSYKTMSIWDDALLAEKAEVTMNSLFCHHFDDAALVLLIRRMQSLCTRYTLINDIHRHWLAYYSIKWITAVFSKTFLVRYDAPLSVARSLTKKEWQLILEKAGIKHYTIKWMWAWRWQIIVPKNDN
jgi:2-polyprenyl-3-methyl-5-hydroxy-6-metoxy-1,4-benzoquinol methylase